MYEIQKGDPPTPVFRARKYPLHIMDIDEWFFVPDKTTEAISSHVHTIGKRLGRKFSLRKSEDGVVVTRIE